MKGRKLVVGFGVFALLFVGMLLFFALRAKEEKGRDAGILLSEASALLGNQTRVWFSDVDVNRDNLPEIVAFDPADTAMPFVSERAWAEAFAVLQRNGRRARVLVHITPNKFLVGDKNWADELQLHTPQGILVRTEADSVGRMSFVVSLADSVGSPASDELFIWWNANHSEYELVRQ